MQQFVIEGGQPLKGSVTVGGNKNAALKMIPAALLTNEPVILNNVPNIGDVRAQIEIVRGLGADVTEIAPGKLRIHAKNVDPARLDYALVSKLRGSLALIAPLVARCGAVDLPMPGGDSIGERRLDMHVLALQALGAVVTFDGVLHIRALTLHGADILLPEASVTATENALMLAVLAKGTTILRNAASEPHVQDLCVMLESMGAQIDGIGTNQLIIEGVERLNGCEARIGADFMEVASYISAAAITGGEITIREADPHHLPIIAHGFARLGVKWETQGSDIFVPAAQALTVVPDLGGRIPTIKAQPWPAFPTDVMSVALTVATQSAGTVMFHDWMYESRFFFTDKLIRMGARITLCDPHRVLVQGPASLHGEANITSPDIRAGMAMLIAALGAKGETRISNIQQIDRGYERIEDKLSALGANITRINVGELPAVETIPLAP